MGKIKGSTAERELIQLFHNAGWAPVRVAGSGSARIPAVDIVAGKSGNVFAVECKSSRSSKIYISKDQVRELAYFASIFGAKAIVGVRFDREAWRFFALHELRDSGKNYVVDKSVAITVGKKFEDLIKTP